MDVKDWLSLGISPKGIVAAGTYTSASKTGCFVKAVGIVDLVLTGVTFKFNRVAPVTIGGVVHPAIGAAGPFAISVKPGDWLPGVGAFTVGSGQALVVEIK